MQFLVIAIILALGAITTFAATGFGKYADPAHPGKCVYGNFILSPGEKAYPEENCIRIICFREDGTVRFHTCGAQAAEPPCVLGDYINSNSPYPQCCRKKIICPDDFIGSTIENNNLIV